MENRGDRSVGAGYPERSKVAADELNAVFNDPAILLHLLPYLLKNNLVNPVNPV